MSITIWSNGSNIAFKINPGPNFKDDKERLKFVTGKIPIYKLDTFDHWEVPKGSWLKLKEVYGDAILLQESGRSFIKELQVLTSKLKDLPRQVLNVVAPNGWVFKDFQLDWITISHRRKGLLLLLDCGMGKTTCSVYRALNLGFEQLLIIAPASILESEWEPAIVEFLGFQPVIYTGSIPRKKRLEMDLSGAKVILANYEMAKELLEKLPTKTDSIIVDEAHNIHNHKSALYKNCKKLIRKYQKLNDASVQLATATPYENNLEEFWTLANLVNPELAGDKQEFLRRFQTVTEVTKIKLRDKEGNVRLDENGEEKAWFRPKTFETKDAKGFADFIERVGMRVNKDFYVKYTPTKPVIIPIEMTKRQKEVYEEVKEDILLLSQDKTFFLENPLTRLGKLLQAAEGAYNIYDDCLESGKMNYIREVVIPKLVKDGRRGIFWFRYLKGSNLLHEFLPETSVLFNGKQNESLKYLAKIAFNGTNSDFEKNKFYELLERYPDFKFREPGTAQYFVATYSEKSGAGLNLPVSDYCCYGSFDYTHTAFKQSSDRNKRLNSEHQKIDTELLAANGTVEIKYLKKMLTKLEQSANMLDGKGTVSGFTARDILRML